MTDATKAALETHILALQSNPNFVAFIQEIETIRERFQKKNVIGLDPTSDPLLVQRHIGYLAGIDCVLDMPDLILAARGKKTEEQKYQGRAEIPARDGA